MIDCVVAPLDQRNDVPPAAVSVTLPPAQKVVAPLAVIVAVGDGLTVTLIAADVPEQPDASVTVTLYEPAVATVIDCDFAPLDQRYDAPDVAVSVTLPPVQKLVGPLAVMIGVKAPTLTVAVPVFGQLFASVTETFNVTADEDVGLNVIAFVPLPDTIVPLVIVHVNVPLAIGGTDADAVLPAQMLDGALIVALGFGLTVTTLGADVAVQLLALPTVTV